MKHFCFFLFQKITMFDFACWLLNEDLQYSRIIFSSFRFSSVTGNYKYNIQRHAVMVHNISVGMLVTWFTHVLTTWGSKHNSALIVVIHRSIVALSIA